jgi:hypothetical protein
LIFGSRNLEGALTGDPATGDDTLRFSVLSGVSAMIETMPLEKAPDACAKMMSGNASVGIGSGFRFVVVLIEAPFERRGGWRTLGQMAPAVGAAIASPPTAGTARTSGFQIAM